jgi:general secretion pathway protein K
MNLIRQRGVALLVAIVMFAVATTVAAAITYNKAMSARRAAASFTLEQAVQAAMAAEALASIALEQAAGNSNQTALHQDWAQMLGPLEIENTGIWIQAQLEDLSARFNLNSLVVWNAQTNSFEADHRQLEVFRNLLAHLNIDQRFADLMADWIDTNDHPQPSGGGEDTLYLTQVPPYRPPNRFITHTSELLALPGLGAENYALLAPYVTALPRDVTINYCTASGVVLDMNNNDGQTQWQNAPLDVNRKKGCWPTASDLQAGFIDQAKWTAAQPWYGDNSSWFRLRTHIRIGTAEFVLYSVLFREQNNRVRVMQRSFGSE